FPGPPVRLGKIGYLREQRFVEVLFTPVLYNPASGQARYVGEIQADVRFDTPAGASPHATKGSFRPDPTFEDTYRTSLVNYEQGKLFRVGPGEAAPESPAMSRVAPQAGSLTVAAAGTPRYKISVSTSGVYRLDYAYLQTRAPELLALDPRTFLLSAEGVEVPIVIRNAAGGSGEADGHFDPGDVLEFYGRSKTEPPTLLNFDNPGVFPDIFAANDFTDTQVYWLTSAGLAGSHLRIGSVSGAPQSPAPPVATDFEASAVWDENNLYLPLGSADPFFSVPSLSAGTTQSQRDITLALPGIAAVAATESVRVRLRGGSSNTIAPDHRTQLWVNGHSNRGTDFTWDGEVIKDDPQSEYSVPQSDLADPTSIHLQLPGIPGVTTDLQYLDTVTIRYRRLFSSVGDVLVFTYPNQDVRFQVGGFSGAGPAIFEITRTIASSNEADPTRIENALVSGSPATYTFDVPRDPSPTAPATRTFIVAGPAGVRVPAAFARASDPVLQDPQNAADYVVIASRDTVDASPGGSLQALLNYRFASQGLTSRIVYIDQIYDEFSYGLIDPNAIRAFLSYAYDNWRGPGGTARPLSFVLLVGDGSLDYKNTLNHPGDWVEQIPPAIMFNQNSIIGYYSSDNWLASFRGADQVPDVYLGRISTRSAADSALVFDKILRYEQTPPPGLWKGRAILMTSEGKPPNAASEADSFIAVQDALASTYFSAPPYSVPSPPLYQSRPPWDTSGATAFHDGMVSELNNGAAILSFIGHGAFDVWGLTTFFTTQDAYDLRNGPLPFMVNINCLSGGFHYLNGGGAVGEGMTNNPYGGAIASFAPSGLSYFFDIGDIFNDQLFGTIFGPTGERGLGPASTQLRLALWGAGKIIDLQGFTFLGDPATVLATPAPQPPTGLTAAAGNGQVGLSWTPPSVPVAGTRIYRAASSPTGSYAPVTCDPVSPSSCIDHTAINATTYYYYAVSVDGDGFAGRASNLNSDCDAGPDCVVARPLNPGPPSVPTGLTSHDTGTGGVLQVSWQANPEPDVSSYTLRYGSSQGQYTSQVTLAAAITTKILTGLVDGTRYYMAISAANTSGKQSALSPEISDVPHLIQGISPPRSISDLQLTRSGDDLFLSWSRPTLDIYGRPTTVVRYDVYRSSSVNYIPSAATRIVTILNGSTTTYRDANAYLLAGNAYYLVTATDGSGLVSGAGRDLPNGIGGLIVSAPAVGMVHLAWSAVTTDVQGYATIIDHYQVHQSATPLARASLGPSTLVKDNLQLLWVDLPVPVGPQFFSVIAVDNRGNLSPF
ncbi:MAG TPA: C25 family cysteine peptidase, partial [Candidatus Polarisedimenticolia bacterium]|nr:C25 family cysteine peptidase [Candidatus Polarisedimenticolia bacterium]